MSYLDTINQLRCEYAGLSVTLVFEGSIFSCIFALNGVHRNGFSSMSMEIAVDRCLEQFKLYLTPDPRQTQLFEEKK